MIKKIFKSFMALFLLYATFRRYNNYQSMASITQKQSPMPYDEYSFKFSKLWDDQFFKPSQNTSPFSVNNTTQSIQITDGQNTVFAHFDKLELDQTDVSEIQSITKVDEKGEVYLISSKYFETVFNTKTGSVCYRRVGEKMNKEKVLEVGDNLWVSTVANSHNVLILRVYSCGTSSAGKMLHSHKYLLPSKTNLLRDPAYHKQNSTVILQAIGFSRDIFQYSFNTETFQLQNYEVKPASTFSYYPKQIYEAVVDLGQSIKEMQIMNCIEQFVYEFTLGYFGRQNLASRRIIREKQNMFKMEVLDTENNLIAEIDTEKKSLKMVSLGEKLLPFRTPVFVDKQELQNMPTIQNVLKDIDSFKDKKIDLKIYEIRTNTILEMKNMLGIYRPAPDSEISFIAINQKIINFYPMENLKDESYSLCRAQKGGVVFKGSKIQGYYDNLPALDTDMSTLRYGQSSHEVYQQLTSNGLEVMPNIYEAHYAYRSLFAIPRKNRVDLIQGLNGAIAITHYLQIKEGYELTGAFIENNEFWVFEHHTSLKLPPIVTKHELFFNASAHKTILTIKRTYNYWKEGKVLSVQKCLDTFYYFESVSNEKYEITRVHQAKMSNRQPRSDGKYAGQFEKNMQLENPQKNTRYLKSPLEQLPIRVSLKIGEQILSNWIKLHLKHQYQILPYRVYFDPINQSYKIFNLRALAINGYDQQVPKIKIEIYLYSVYFLAALSIIALCSLAIPDKKPEASRKIEQEAAPKASKKSQKKQGPVAYESIDYKKKK